MNLPQEYEKIQNIFERIVDAYSLDDSDVFNRLGRIVSRAPFEILKEVWISKQKYSVSVSGTVVSEHQTVYQLNTNELERCLQFELREEDDELVLYLKHLLATKLNIECFDYFVATLVDDKWVITRTTKSESSTAGRLVGSSNEELSEQYWEYTEDIRDVELSRKIALLKSYTQLLEAFDAFIKSEE